MSLDQSIDFVIKRMVDDGILHDNSAPRVADSMIEESVSAQEVAEFNALKSIDIDVEQAEYL